MINEKKNFYGIAFKDVTYTASFSVGYNSLTIANPNIADYVITGMALKTGSNVALRNDVILFGFGSADNANRLWFYSSSATSGTLTVRYFYTSWTYIHPA